MRRGSEKNNFSKEKVFLGHVKLVMVRYLEVQQYEIAIQKRYPWCFVNTICPHNHHDMSS